MRRYLISLCFALATIALTAIAAGADNWPSG
jgi:hypothetical protein